MASPSSPFPSLKTTGDNKHDMEVYIEDLVDYCVMHNWYDPAKECDEEKWTKPDKGMACLQASLSPAARSIYKYSLGLAEENQKKPHLVVAALKEFYFVTTATGIPRDCITDAHVSAYCYAPSVSSKNFC